VQPPTYRQFREFALQRGMTPQTLAPHIQSDHPEKAAERFLVHLVGTRWDDELLPYPKLCQLYQGTTDTTTAERRLTPDEETAWIEGQFRLGQDGEWTPQRIINYYKNSLLQWRVDQAPKLAKALEKLSPARTSTKRCQCRCRKKVTGRAKFATAACQRRAHRQRARAEVA
jgi:hypothetical protein